MVLLLLLMPRRLVALLLLLLLVMVLVLLRLRLQNHLLQHMRRSALLQLDWRSRFVEVPLPPYVSAVHCAAAAAVGAKPRSWFRLLLLQLFLQATLHLQSVLQLQSILLRSRDRLEWRAAGAHGASIFMMVLQQLSLLQQLLPLLQSLLRLLLSLEALLLQLLLLHALLSHALLLHILQ